MPNSSNCRNEFTQGPRDHLIGLIRPSHKNHLRQESIPVGSKLPALPSCNSVWPSTLLLPTYETQRKVMFILGNVCLLTWTGGWVNRLHLIILQISLVPCPFWGEGYPISIHNPSGHWSHVLSGETPTCYPTTSAHRGYPRSGWGTPSPPPSAQTGYAWTGYSHRRTFLIKRSYIRLPLGYSLT